VLQISGSWLHVSATLQPTYTDQVPSVCLQYGIPYCTHIEGTWSV